MTIWLLAMAALQAGQAPAPPAQQPPPAVEQPSTVSSDPAGVTFTGDAGLLLAAIKPDRTADYEAAIAALHAALAATEDPEVRRMADGWTVFKAAEADAAGNALYVHIVRRPVEAADYRPSMLLDALLAEAPSELLATYRDAFAGAPSKLSLIEVADLSGPPPPPKAEGDNATPAGPAPPPGPATSGNHTPEGPRPPGRH